MVERVERAGGVDGELEALVANRVNDLDRHVVRRLAPVQRDLDAVVLTPRQLRAPADGGPRHAASLRPAAAPSHQGYPDTDPYIWSTVWPRVESNHRTQLRRLPLYPLSYGAVPAERVSARSGGDGRAELPLQVGQVAPGVDRRAGRAPQQLL